MWNVDPEFSGRAVLETIGKITRANRRFRAFQESNPGSTFADWYVHKNKLKLDQGLIQPNLGGVIDENYARLADKTLVRLRGLGLKPYHRFVDYGCGSLRLGRTVIPYLDPGNYWGLDVDPTFYEFGRQMVGEAAFERGRPHLQAISPASLRETQDFEPDMLVCLGVIFHIPPAEILLTVQRLGRLIQKSTVGLVKIAVWSGPTVRTSAESWLYNDGYLVGLFKSQGLRIERIPLGKRFVAGLSLPSRSYWLRLTRVYA